MRSADAIIIGAGVIGASVAYHLARAGCTDVLVLERQKGPGEGSTGRATGGFRAQFGSAINVRLSLLSLQKLLRFEDEIGIDPGLTQCGYLLLAQEQATLDQLAASREVQREAGLTDTRIVGSEEIHRLNPALHLNAVCGGVFGPGDGFIRPLRILTGYLDAARRLGVRVEYEQPCIGVESADGRVTGVRTPAGIRTAGVVVNAAGAWAAAVAESAGVTIPVTPLRRQVAITGPFAHLPENMPMTVFVDDGFHLRVRDGRVLLLRPDVPKTLDPCDLTIDRGWFDAVVARAAEAVPCLREATIRFEECWSGLYEMSPDSHALLGAAPELENLYLACGSSGHGVMHAPALGQLLAEIIVGGGARTLDVRALRPSRFAEGEPNVGSAIL